jgi:hypothetical protein
MMIGTKGGRHVSKIMRNGSMRGKNTNKKIDEWGKKLDERSKGKEK